LRLLMIGAISQVPYAWVVTPDRLNICFTLAFGLLAVVLLDQVKGQRSRMATAVVLFLLAAVPALPRGLRLSWYPLHLVAITVALMAINQGAS